MSFRYLAGDGLNLLERGTVTVSPAEDSLYPATGLYDGRFNPPFKWGSADEDAYVLADLNVVPNGDGEGADFDDWTLVGTNATLEASSSGPYTGTYSNRLYLSSGTLTSCSAEVQFRLRAGEKAKLYRALYLTTGDYNAVYITCENTQRSLNSSGTWTTAGTPIANRTVASWGDGALAFTAPTFEELGGEWGTFTLKIELTASPAAALDGKFEMKVVPGWDFVGVFGHGSTKYFAPEFRYQALINNNPLDAWSSGTVPTFARGRAGYDTGTAQAFPADDLRQPAVYNYLSSVRYERWVQITPTANGGTTPGAAQGFGEIVLGQSKTVEVNPDYPVNVRTPMRGQIRNETRAGDIHVYNASRYPAREIRWFVSPRTSTAAQLEEIIYLMHQATQGGRYPMILCPTEIDASAVYYGSLVDAIDLSRPHHAYSTVELLLQEYPFPDLRILGT